MRELDNNKKIETLNIYDELSIGIIIVAGLERIRRRRQKWIYLLQPW